MFVVVKLNKFTDTRRSPFPSESLKPFDYLLHMNESSNTIQHTPIKGSIRLSSLESFILRTLQERTAEGIDLSPIELWDGSYRFV